jgi:hypothetical protein
MKLRRAARGLVFGGLLAVTPGCDSPFGPRGDVEIRITNASAFQFERVDAVFPEDEVSFGAIAAHRSSDYRRVSTAYRYAYLEVQINGEELRIQPIDYVGEDPLDPGKYTYVLNVTVEGHLTLEFQKN